MTRSLERHSFGGRDGIEAAVTVATVQDLLIKINCIVSCRLLEQDSCRCRVSFGFVSCAGGKPTGPKSPLPSLQTLLVPSPLEMK